MTARLASLLAAVLATGMAYGGDIHYEYARVVEVEPRYQTVREPIEREVCWDEQVREPVRGRRDTTTPTIVGAIIGGVIGNQFGDGNGRRAATVAGAALGGSIGRDAARQSRHRDDYYVVMRERCTIQRDYAERTIINGYRVGYEYRGNVHYTTLREHPGDRIRLRVSVSPID
jgi:uncharacterized protein YcfJ